MKNLLENQAWKIGVILILIISNIGCDQVSKNIVRDEVMPNKQIDVMGDFLMLTNVENTGAFLSMGAGADGAVRWVLFLILPTIIILGLVIYLLFSKKLSPALIIAFSFIAGGGIGNLYDRYLYGSVTDFLHMDFGIFRTGIFNMADVSIMVGMFIILGGMILETLENRKTKKLPPVDQ